MIVKYVLNVKDLISELVDRDLDHLLQLSVDASNLAEAYKQNNIKVPDWLKNGIPAVQSQIKDRVRNERLLELKKLELEENSLKTRAERKAEVATRKAEIMKELE